MSAPAPCLETVEILDTPAIPAAPDHPSLPLSIRQQSVLNLLAQGVDVSAAASQAGVHRTTIHHWRRTSPAFAQALHQLRADTAAQLAFELGDLASTAIDTLRRLLLDSRTPHAVQLKAALAVLRSASLHSAAPLVTSASADVPDSEIEEGSSPVSPAETAAIHRNSSRSSAISSLGGLSPNELPIPPARRTPYRNPEPKISRNAPCPCESGQKYKRCCGKAA